jgi:Spy/CpxP family protein refolding chaperone
MTTMAILLISMLVCYQVQSMAQPGSPLPRKEMQERINTIMIAKLDKYLDLTVEQADKFFPRFRQFTNRRDELEQQRLGLIDELIAQEQLDPTNEKEIEELLDRVHIVDVNMVELRQQFREDIRPILSPAQRARLVIFSHQFPEQVRQLIDDVRQQRMEQKRRNQPPGHQNPPPLGR